MDLVSLPLELRNFIMVTLTAAVTYVVVEGLKALSAVLHIDLSAAATAIAAAVSSVVVAAVLGLFDALLASIPPQYEAIANTILALLVILLGMFGAMGIHSFIKKNREANAGYLSDEAQG